MVPQLRSVHQYKGDAFPDLIGRHVVVVIADEAQADAGGDARQGGGLAVFPIEGQQVSDFAYAVAADDLEPLHQEWNGILPFPRVVLHARGVD